MDQNQSQPMSLPQIKPVKASCAMDEVFPSLTEGDWDIPVVTELKV